MENSIKNVSIVNNCSGCFACSNICPTNAIEMVLSKEGFYVPKIVETLCTNCGLCLKVCPIMNVPSGEDKFSAPKVYASWSLDEKTRLSSSSGGLYPELAKLILENDGVVFAVGWNKEWLPQHKEVSSFDQIPETQGSKYVQSHVGSTYRRVAEFAKSGTKVLFVGTPCQVAGLRNLLERTGITQDNTILVDLVCHGTPSPFVFKKYLVENFDSDKITAIFFRNKITGWSTFSFSIIEKDSKTYSVRHFRDSFFWGFLRNLYLTQTCYNCPFSKLPRQGDITLGDFWGVPDKYKDERGVSVVLVNSKKGERIFNQLSEKQRIFAEEVPLATVTKANPRIISGLMNVPKERDKILAEIHVKSWKYISHKYIKPPVGLRGFLRRSLSFAKRTLKRFIKR